MKFLNKLKKKAKDKQLKYITLLLIVATFLTLIFIKPAMTTDNAFENVEGREELMVFVQDNCHFCQQAENFLIDNKEDFKDVNVVFYNLKNNSSQVKLFKNISRLNISQNGLGTPIFILGDDYIVGFGETQKSNLINLLNEKKIK